MILYYNILYYIIYIYILLYYIILYCIILYYIIYIYIYIYYIMLYSIILDYVFYYTLYILLYYMILCIACLQDVWRAYVSAQSQHQRVPTDNCLIGCPRHRTTSWHRRGQPSLPPWPPQCCCPPSWTRTWPCGTPG